jgi:tetratricopeptide (TPR) repeat protein
MRALESRMKEAGMRYQVRSFDGDHSWPPAALGTEALEWMEVQAMKSGLRPKDAALLQQAADRRLAEADALLAGGKAYAAAAWYANMIADFDGLIDVTGWKEKDAAVRASAAVLKEDEAWKRRDREAHEFLAKLASFVRSVRSGPRIPEVATVKAFLDIDSWKAKAANKADPEESLHAGRLLSSVMGQTTFYLPRAFQEYGDFPRAVMVLTLATEIRPDASWAWYNLACSHALSGDAKKALEALRKCVDTGFADIATMESDSDLRSLRGEKEYRKLEDIVRKNAEKAKKAGGTPG